MQPTLPTKTIVEVLVSLGVTRKDIGYMLYMPTSKLLRVTDGRSSLTQEEYNLLILACTNTIRRLRKLEPDPCPYQREWVEARLKVLKNITTAEYDP